MAEFRKHDPAAGNAIAQALRAAMGEPVRPNQPGRQPADTPAKESTAKESTAKTSWVTLQVSKPAEPDEADED